MGKIKIVVVNGLSRSGKDSFIAAVRKKVVASRIHSTIATVKNALLICGMIAPNKKGPDERTFLTAVKKAWIKYNDGPLQEMIQKVVELEDSYKLSNNVTEVLLFIQVREPQEIYKIQQYFKPNFVSVLVTRLDVKPQPGDEEVFNYLYDLTVYNDGTFEDLDNEADRFLRFSKEKERIYL